jgi:hypothetical protein
LVSSTHLGPETRFLLVSGLLMWGALSGERTGPSFTIAACSRQRSLPRVRVPQIRYLPNLESQVPVFIFPQEQGGPVIPPGPGFSFHHLLGLGGIRWKYSNLPPRRRDWLKHLVMDCVENVSSIIAVFLRCRGNTLVCEVVA